MYHAIDKLENPTLKWLNFRTLAQTLIREGESLGDINFFTAVWPYEATKQKRHENFIAAQEFYGVKVHRGKFSKPKRWCENHKRYCPFREEKQTDVAIAVKMLSDATDGQIQRMVLVTADSDQLPTARALLGLENVSLTLAFPPGRSGEARELGTLIPDRLELKPQRMLTCKLPRTIEHNGKVIATMPAIYGD